MSGPRSRARCKTDTVEAVSVDGAARVELSPYADPPPAVSPLELAIAQLVADGLTLEQAAQRLSYSYVHVRRVDAALRVRLQVTTRAQLVAQLVYYGLVRVR
jgi:DNA-binding NarL/FixJ family response regulator